MKSKVKLLNWVSLLNTDKILKKLSKRIMHNLFKT